MGPENSSQYQAVKNTLQKNRVPMVILPPEEFSKHIPNVNLSEGDGAMVDTTAGVLFADRALRAVQVGGDTPNDCYTIGLRFISAKCTKVICTCSSFHSRMPSEICV